MLVAAADRLVVSAVRLSRELGVSAVLIGALVIGLGTSVPELLVSVIAAIDQRLDVAVANVVGSNVANLTLVLGGAALMAPVVAQARTLRREGMLMLISVLGLSAVLVGGVVERWEGAALLGGMVLAVYVLVRWSVGDGDARPAAEVEVGGLAGGKVRLKWLTGATGLVALAATVLSANLLLNGALEIGERVGLSETFLGVMLGVGTSLPELATALAAMRRRETDLVVGNVLGSNIFNSLAVAGVAGLVGPGILIGITTPVLALMVLAAVVAGFFARTGQRLVRSEGVLLLAGFVVFAAVTF